MLLLLRRHAARSLDVLAVVLLLAAAVRFVVLPRLHGGPVPAPALSVATLEGGRFDLHRARGRVVFVDFWATWCDPCRDEIPLVQRFVREHPDAVVSSVDVGENPAVVRPFAAKLRMRGVAFDPEERVAHAFGVTGFPTMIAIDPQGRIRARWIGYRAQIDREMADALARYRS